MALIIIGQDTRAFSAWTRTLVCLCQLTWELEEEEANRVPSITFQVKSNASTWNHVTSHKKSMLAIVGINSYSGDVLNDVLVTITTSSINEGLIQL